MDFNTLRDNLKQSYKQANWKDWLLFIFGQQINIETQVESIVVKKGNAKSIERFASITLSDGKNIAVLDVQTTKDVQIARNRVALREIAFKLIDQDKYHGLLVFYHSEDKKQLDYRLSFISSQNTINQDGEFINQSTNSKRYSFILGENESCYTATKNILELKSKVPSFKAFEIQKGITLKDLTDTFSVEALNNEFFKKYKDIHYKRFWEYIANNPNYAALLLNTEETEPIKQQKPIRDFVKKMLGRIVFLHFLQKKGWMGCPADMEEWKDGDKNFMQNLFTNCGNQKEFYSKYLTVLFFQILNTDRRKKNDLIPKNLNYTNPKIKSKEYRAPFLNGGLFDDDQPQTSSFDFPIDYFKDLFEFFSQYNFTIDENSPEEQEVGIDPEMLGHIFENLLEENKDKGAFYTPKEIVHYMCQESLIQYLRTHLPECKDDDSHATSSIETFIHKNDIGNRTEKKNFIVANAKRIEAILDKVKICDPAIGSGAFPMGMLQEIFKAKTILDLTLDKAQVKKEIIQNSIYGVDIEKGAVDIARLRFWLSLIVDEDVPQPLPNLDYKIMQGNSLLESFEEIDLSGLLNEESNEPILYDQNEQVKLFQDIKQSLILFDAATKNELQELINLYYDFEESKASRFQTKQAVKQAINTIIESKLKSYFYLKKKNYENEKAEIETSISANRIIPTDSKGIENKKAKNIEKLTKSLTLLSYKINHLTEILHKLNQLEKENKERPYFLWHTYFKDVFEGGGFDIVIANPPYIKERGNAHTFKQVNESEFGKMWHTGKMDYWFYFLHKAIDVSNEKGIITFITSRYWLNSLGAKKLINRVQDNLSFTNFVDIGKLKVFDNVAGHHMIGIYSKRKQIPFVYKKIQNDISEIGSTINSNNIKIRTLYNNKIYNANSEIIIEDDSINYKKEFILGDVYDVAQGVVEAPDKISTKNINEKPNPNIHVGDGVFVLTEKELSNLRLTKSEQLVIVPYLDPSNVGKYLISERTKKFLIYSDKITRENIAEDSEYSNLKNHLSKYEAYITSSNGPYGLHRSRIQKYFLTEKIIFKNMFVEPEFTIDTKGYYLGFSFSSILKKNKDFSLKYLLAILNSKFAAFWFYQNGKIRGAGVDIGVEKLRLFPINSCTEQEKFNIIVDYLLFINNGNNPPVNDFTDNANIAPVFEDVVNMMVYEMYFKQHMQELELDVLQFIDTKKHFKPIDITETANKEDNAKVIGECYKWLQGQDNAIRNRIILSNIKSADIIRKINANTH